jgi:hypothetical protein
MTRLRAEEVALMIRFSLRCASGHEFEGWFRNGEGYEAQQKAGEIACPECGDTHVEKALMAPSIGRSREARPPISPTQLRAALVELRQQVESIAIMSARNSPRKRAASITGRATRAAFMARRPKTNRAN